MPFDLVSALTGFLLGTATGAAGRYLADRSTDQRRRRESQAQALNQLASIRARASELLAEIEADLRKSPHLRELILLPNERMQYTHAQDRVVIYEESQPKARSQLTLLEGIGYIEQVSNGDFPLYRLRESFATALTDLS